MSGEVLWGVLMPENKHGRRPQIPAKDRRHAEQMAPKLGGEVAEYTGLPEVHAAWLELGGLVRYAKEQGAQAPGVLEAITSMGEWELRTMLLLAVAALADNRLDPAWLDAVDQMDTQGPKEAA